MKLSDYEPIVGKSVIEELRSLGRRLRGKVVCNINSTKVGGGVAEILQRLNPFLNEHNATLLIINQTRQKIGVMFGSDQTKAGGGKALEYYCSSIIKIASTTKIEDKNLSSKHTKKLLGVNLSFRNEKNRCFTPFMNTAQVQLYFDRGINPVGGLLSILLAAERIEKSSAGNYKVVEELSDGKEIKFKSSEARNDVPVELLLECPALIDCETKEEVVEYLNTFGEAIELSTSDSTQDVPIGEEVDDGNPLNE